MAKTSALLPLLITAAGLPAADVEIDSRSSEIIGRARSEQGEHPSTGFISMMGDFQGVLAPLNGRRSTLIAPDVAAARRG